MRKKVSSCALLILLLAGCGEGDNGFKIPGISFGDQKKNDHHYVLYEKGAYGYESALTQEEIDRDRPSMDIVMFRYVGEQDGRWQVFTESGDVILVIECNSKPCEFIKIMEFPDVGPASRAKLIRVKSKALLYKVMEDATSGKLAKRAKIKFNDSTEQVYHMWFDEKKGRMLFPVEKAPSQEVKL